MVVLILKLSMMNSLQGCIGTHGIVCVCVTWPLAQTVFPTTELSRFQGSALSVSRHLLLGYEILPQYSILILFIPI